MASLSMYVVILSDKHVIPASKEIIRYTTIFGYFKLALNEIIEFQVHTHYGVYIIWLFISICAHME